MYSFTKLHDRRIPNVGVRVRIVVGPVEFQLSATLFMTTPLSSLRPFPVNQSTYNAYCKNPYIHAADILWQYVKYSITQPI